MSFWGNQKFYRGLNNARFPAKLNSIIIQFQGYAIGVVVAIVLCENEITNVTSFCNFPHVTTNAAVELRRPIISTYLYTIRYNVIAIYTRNYLLTWLNNYRYSTRNYSPVTNQSKCKLYIWWMIIKMVCVNKIWRKFYHLLWTGIRKPSTICFHNV